MEVASRGVASNSGTAARRPVVAFIPRPCSVSPSVWREGTPCDSAGPTPSPLLEGDFEDTRVSSCTPQGPEPYNFDQDDFDVVGMTEDGDLLFCRRPLVQRPAPTRPTEMLSCTLQYSQNIDEAPKDPSGQHSKLTLLVQRQQLLEMKARDKENDIHVLSLHQRIEQTELEILAERQWSLANAFRLVKAHRVLRH